MTLVNVVPQVGPDPKTGVSGMGTFVGGSNPFPAPCVPNSLGLIGQTREQMIYCTLTFSSTTPGMTHPGVLRKERDEKTVI